LGSTVWSNLNLRVLSGTTVLASSADPRNLYEKVTFTAPATGTVTVEVSAASLDAAAVEDSLASPNAFASGTPASYALYGDACAGSAGTPGLSVSGNPVLGGSFAVKLAFARPNSAATLLLGVSSTTWNGLSLPFDLGLFGYAPKCFILAAGNSAMVGTTTA